MRLLFIGLMIASVLCLSCCGQRGPLYLPKAKNISPTHRTAVHHAKHV